MPKLDPVLVALGRNVRRQRDAKTFTQEKLAEKYGLDPTYISDIERGLRNPGIKNVAKLANSPALRSKRAFSPLNPQNWRPTWELPSTN